MAQIYTPKHLFYDNNSSASPDSVVERQCPVWNLNLQPPTSSPSSLATTQLNAPVPVWMCRIQTAFPCFTEPVTYSQKGQTSPSVPLGWFRCTSQDQYSTEGYLNQHLTQVCSPLLWLWGMTRLQAQYSSKAEACSSHSNRKWQFRWDNSLPLSVRGHIWRASTPTMPLYML